VSERSGMRSGNVSEDEGSWTDESNSIISSTTSSPRGRRKRLRSLTPSEIGLNGEEDSDVLRSRLAKRKKIAAERTGTSKLKEAITAADFAIGVASEDDENVGKVSTPTGIEEDDTDDSDDSDSDDSSMDDEEDDFLARELEEEWG